MLSIYFQSSEAAISPEMELEIALGGVEVKRVDENAVLPTVVEAPSVLVPLSSEVVYDADGRPTNKVLYHE